MKYLHTADPLFIEKLDKTHQLLEEYDEQVSGQVFCVNTSLGKRDFLFTESFYETLRIKLSYLQGTLPENISPFILKLIKEDLSRNPYSLKDLQKIEVAYIALKKKMDEFKLKLDDTIKMVWDDCDTIEKIISTNLAFKLNH